MIIFLLDMITLQPVMAVASKNDSFLTTKSGNRIISCCKQ